MKKKKVVVSVFNSVKNNRTIQHELYKIRNHLRFNEGEEINKEYLLCCLSSAERVAKNKILTISN